jgi:Na+-transporting NADH:ubiquinone oxidoreductase subunit E
MSFGGMLTGGDEEAAPAPKVEAVIEKVEKGEKKQEKKDIAINTKTIK